MGSQSEKSSATLIDELVAKHSIDVFRVCENGGPTSCLHCEHESALRSALEELLASVRGQQAELEAFAADCVEELEYVQCSREACGSNMCASDRGRELIEQSKSLLPPAPPAEKEGQ